MVGSIPPLEGRERLSGTGFSLVFFGGPDFSGGPVRVLNSWSSSGGLFRGVQFVRVGFTPVCVEFLGRAKRLWTAVESLELLVHELEAGKLGSWEAGTQQAWHLRRCHWGKRLSGRRLLQGHNFGHEVHSSLSS